ncbi:RNA polymerase, sigma-24 subunit, ECF subfamily [Pseudofrankia inefficax]|uniref:RNA polymerase, sigma-24 subunit, ECF subfamily n=1 Tax=Pseudofrankia inefficax (strain DSM 45817 / CECT 9037 / DDB 130130 / EuI1c) TaxID=298654 RepID=E3IVR1_PSEI1|nr:RNA polymerase, sigma-24 subunit, ECF subfamily [Pseudofrankia inefficax]
MTHVGGPDDCLDGGLEASTVPRADQASARSAPPDDALVARAAAGDRSAFDRLVGPYQRQLWAVCRRITGDDQDADDALQNALVAAWTSLPGFEGRSRLSTWLHRVATNAALDEVRRRSRRPAPVAELPVEAVAAEPALADRVADRLAFDAAVATLAAPFRATLLLRDVCGLSYLEIARERGIPVDTVKSQLHRGRQAVAARLVA